MNVDRTIPDGAPGMNQKHLMWIAAACVFLSTAVLALSRLDNTCFWDDESDVAVVAKNLALQGRFSYWDGRNLLASRNGGAVDLDLGPKGSPPLCYLVTAASFLIFGVSTWAGRFPSVLAGLVTLAILAIVLRRKFGERSPVWLYGTSCLGFSVGFLLNIRQCRYQALVMLCAILSYFFYTKFVIEGKHRWLAALTITAIFFFYAHLMLFCCFALALALVHFTFYADSLSRRHFWSVLVGILCFLAAVLPYTVYAKLWVRPDLYLDSHPWFIRRPLLLWWNFRDISQQAPMSWFAALGLTASLIQGRRSMPAVYRTAVEWAVLILGYIFFLSLLSPQPTEMTHIADLRYMGPIEPFIAGLLGVFLWTIHRKSVVISLTIFAVLVTSNVSNLNPWKRQFRWTLPAYIKELSKPYPTCYSAVTAFLRQTARKDDVVYCSPQYAQGPLIFYAGDHIRIGGMLDRNTQLPMPLVKSLSAPLLVENVFPDWIVFFGAQQHADDVLKFFSRPHDVAGKTVFKTYTMATVLNIYCFDTSRPELPWHEFGPKQNFDIATEAVYIFRRNTP